MDDTTQVKMENIRIHDSFSFALKTRLNWSKNVNEERDAPWQIVLGCMDQLYCVLISLALWLEFFLMGNPIGAMTPYVFAFSDDITIPNGGVKSKDTVQGVFGKDVFKRMSSLMVKDPLAATVFENMLLVMFDDADVQKMRKTFVNDGKGRGECRMYMMMWSSLIPMPKYVKSSVSGGHVNM